MPTICILLIAGSACLHAGWNLLCKTREPSAAFFLLANTTSLLVLAPVLAWHHSEVASFPTAVWVAVAATGLVQAFYYTALGHAYRLTEVSIAYPMARALPVLFIPVITGLLAIGRPLAPGAVAGMVLVAAGCLVLPLPRWRDLRLSTFANRALLFVLGAALGTTAYTIIDSEALRILRAAGRTNSAQTTILYLGLELAAIEVFLTPYVLTLRRERQILAGILQRAKRYAVICGLSCTFSYSLVLAAMMLASNVSYVMAFRQLSIPLGAALGVVLLKEPPTLQKLAGVGVITTGLAIVALC